ncbi:uncharacterized protein LOC131622522 [Vicia villosa]|uniref:uncharacterized protein LOC131622522 n=1 Tax=Vicia villosa TaxID=3911 RepID=UPI00273AAB7F|nr:uncharacterized protein LOC131622522 [Vicia villosa]
MLMLLLEWRPDFSMERDMLRSVPIWVKFPKLSIQMWGERSLGKIGSVIGTPLFTDEFTAAKLRVTYARILVEVDVTQKLQDEIMINYEREERNQKVEYEWRPQYCEACEKVGHICNKEKKPMVKMWQQKSGQEKGEASKEEKKEPEIGLDMQNTLVIQEDNSKEDGIWTVVLKGSRETGKNQVHSLKHIFSNNGFSTLGVWNDSEVIPLRDT